MGRHVRALDRMLLRVRLAGAARLAVSLSGGPRVLALNAPVEEHRCSCGAQRGEHHECECAICRKAALTAQAEDEKAPPCHRAAARKALSERTRQGSRSVPCFEGICGGSGQPKMTPPAGYFDRTARQGRTPSAGPTLRRPHPSRPAIAPGDRLGGSGFARR